MELSPRGSSGKKRFSFTFQSADDDEEPDEETISFMPSSPPNHNHCLPLGAVGTSFPSHSPSSLLLPTSALRSVSPLRGLSDMRDTAAASAAALSSAAVIAANSFAHYSDVPSIFSETKDELEGFAMSLSSRSVIDPSGSTAPPPISPLSTKSVSIDPFLEQLDRFLDEEAEKRAQGNLNPGMSRRKSVGESSVPSLPTQPLPIPITPSSSSTTVSPPRYSGLDAIGTPPPVAGADTQEQPSPSDHSTAASDGPRTEDSTQTSASTTPPAKQQKVFNVADWINPNLSLSDLPGFSSSSATTSDDPTAAASPRPSNYTQPLDLQASTTLGASKDKTKDESGYVFEPFVIPPSTPSTPIPTPDTLDTFGTELPARPISPLPKTPSGNRRQRSFSSTLPLTRNSSSSFGSTYGSSDEEGVGLIHEEEATIEGLSKGRGGRLLTGKFGPSNSTTALPSLLIPGAIPEEAKVRNWNAEFQSFYDMVECEQKYENLLTLSNDFVYAAKTYGKIILSELCLPNHQKTIKQLEGGVAGGRKFRAAGILFKLCLDEKHDKRDKTYIYSGSEYPNHHAALKSGSHELKGLIQIFNARSVAREVRLPMQAIITYRGFRLVAMPWLPIQGNATLKYGSSNAGISLVASDLILNSAMRRIGQFLNLQPHAMLANAPMDTTRTKNQKSNDNENSASLSATTTTTTATPSKDPNEMVIMHLCADIEGHLGTDGNYYLVDFARVLPPEYAGESGDLPDLGNTTLFYRLRPEFVKNKRLPPLNSDACSRFMNRARERDRIEATEAIKQATHKLLYNIIPFFARAELANKTEYELQSFQIDLEMHRKGINLRHLGRVRKCLTECPGATPAKLELILREIVARVCKNHLRQLFRDEMEQLDIGPSSEPFITAALNYLNMLLARNERHSIAYWTSPMFLKAEILTWFPQALTETERSPDYFLADGLEMYSLILRICHLTGIRLSKVALEQLKANPKMPMKLQKSDLKRMKAVVKYLDIASHAKAKILLMQARTCWKEHNYKQAARLFSLSAASFMSAHATNTTNLDILFDWAHCEFNSALLCLSLVSQLSKLQAAERLLVQCRDISSMNKNLAIALAYTWIKLGALQSDELRRNDYFGSAMTEILESYKKDPTTLEDVEAEAQRALKLMPAALPATQLSWPARGFLGTNWAYDREELTPNKLQLEEAHFGVAWGWYRIVLRLCTVKEKFIRQDLFLDAAEILRRWGVFRLKYNLPGHLELFARAAHLLEIALTFTSSFYIGNTQWELFTPEAWRGETAQFKLRIQGSSNDHHLVVKRRKVIPFSVVAVHGGPSNLAPSKIAPLLVEDNGGDGNSGAGGDGQLTPIDISSQPLVLVLEVDAAFFWLQYVRIKLLGFKGGDEEDVAPVQVVSLTYPDSPTLQAVIHSLETSSTQLPTQLSSSTTSVSGGNSSSSVPSWMRGGGAFFVKGKNSTSFFTFRAHATVPNATHLVVRIENLDPTATNVSITGLQFVGSTKGVFRAARKLSLTGPSPVKKLSTLFSTSMVHLLSVVWMSKYSQLLEGILHVGLAPALTPSATTTPSSTSPPSQTCISPPNTSSSRIFSSSSLLLFNYTHWQHYRAVNRMIVATRSTYFQPDFLDFAECQFLLRSPTTLRFFSMLCHVKYLDARNTNMTDEQLELFVSSSTSTIAFKFNGCPMLTNKALDILVKYRGQTLSLLGTWDAFNEKLLVRLAQLKTDDQLPMLEHLDLSEFKQLQSLDSAMRKLLSANPMTTLDFTRCKATITRKAFESCAARLQAVVFGANESCVESEAIGDELVIELVSRCGDSLRCLELPFTSITDASMRMIAAKCPQLEVINIDGCSGVTDEGIVALSKMTTLKDVSLQMKRVLAPLKSRSYAQSFPLMEKNWSRLRTLVLSRGAIRPDNETLLCKILEGSASTLQTLDLSWCAITPSLTGVALELCTNLVHLQLEYCTQIADHLVPIFLKCKRLQRVGLNGCMASDDSMAVLLRREEGRAPLHTLLLAGCVAITDKTCKLLCDNHASTLQILSVTGCSISVRSIHDISVACKNLKLFDFSLRRADLDPDIDLAWIRKRLPDTFIPSD